MNQFVAQETKRMHSEGLLLIAQRIGAGPFASFDRSFVVGATAHKVLGRFWKSTSVPTPSPTQVPDTSSRARAPTRLLFPMAMAIVKSTC